MARPLHLIPEHERHGVTAYARMLAHSCGCEVISVAPDGPGTALHLHFTERLWGDGPEAAAVRVTELARHHRLSVTLHDLPQASDGADSQRRRAGAYAQVLRVARGVACNSHWEAQLLVAFAEPRQAPAVIPLAVAPLVGPSPADRLLPTGPPAPVGSAGPLSVGLLGFIYPGKGHAEAIDAAALCAESLGRRVDVIAVGAVSDGHGGSADLLRERARGRGVAFSVTGWVTAAELRALARKVNVPLAAHRHVSASASIGSWLSAGRRPLVADSAYAREIDGLRPGTIRRYDPADLSAAMLQAITDPPAGWLAAGADLRPGPAETAAAYLRWWTHEVSW